MLSMVLSSENEIDVVGLAGNAEKILDICRQKNPDVVLLDIKMPGSNGIFALETLKKEMPHVKVIMLTTFGDERTVIEAYKKGANGYVLKDIKPQMLIMAIKCVFDM
jgi:DNA-binding NarL/FixJ family response regulator